ncbi:MAG: hypothetical protein R3F11_30195 [Verrucomicrobiales bacterium]
MIKASPSGLAKSPHTESSFAGSFRSAAAKLPARHSSSVATAFTETAAVCTSPPSSEVSDSTIGIL